MAEDSSYVRMTRSMRLERDQMAMKDIRNGMRVGDVAMKYGLSRMGLWKRRQAAEAEQNKNRG